MNTSVNKLISVAYETLVKWLVALFALEFAFRHSTVIRRTFNFSAHDFALHRDWQIIAIEFDGVFDFEHIAFQCSFQGNIAHRWLTMHHPAEVFTILLNRKFG